MKFHKIAGICVPRLFVFHLIFHIAAAGLQKDLEHEGEGKKLDQSHRHSKHNTLITSDVTNSQSVTRDTGTKINGAPRTNPRKSRLKTRQSKKPVEDILVLNETPNKTLVYEIPVSNPKSSSAEATDKFMKSGSLFKREIAKHPEQMKKLEVRRKDKLISGNSKTKMKNGLVVKPHNNLPSKQKMKDYEMQSSFISAGVSDPRTLLLAPLLVAGPMMLAEAMTVGGMGLAVPGIIILPLLLIPLIIVSFIIFI